MGLAASVVTSVAVASSAVARTPATHYVDDDGRASMSDGCRGQDRVPRRIQTAIDRSGRDDTILVCPGTYREGLAIQGHDHDGLRVRAVTLVRPVIRARQTAVLVAEAHRVRIQGFAIRMVTPAGRCGTLADAIDIDWDSEGNVIDGNHIRDAKNDSCPISRLGIGIMLSPAQGVVRDNVVRDFLIAGIWTDTEPAGGPVTTRPSIVVRNRVRFWPQAAPGDGHGCREGVTTGIVVWGRAVVRENHVGAERTSAGHRGRLCTGIRVLHAEPDAELLIRIRDNVVERARVGIRLGGIHRDITGARVRGNDFRTSLLLACRDESDGGPPEPPNYGTQNTWINNLGAASEPPGICALP